MNEEKLTTIWRPIKNTGALYHISNTGLVISYKGYGKRFLKPSFLRCEGKITYRAVTLYIEGIKTRYKIAQLVAKAFIPNPENKPLVNHKDLNKQNDHVSNLEWVTYSENNKHAWDMGANRGCRGKSNIKDNKGCKNGNSSLIDSDVISIRKLASKGMSTRDLAIKYKLTVHMINNIKARRSWQHI